MGHVRAAPYAFRTFPPGHFYSPIPSADDVGRDADRIFRTHPRTLSGITLNEDAQLAFLTAIAAYYAEMPFQPRVTEGLRYYFENPMLGYADGICLYGMIRHLKPRRIIEVGSGFSSAAMLDTNERFFGGQIACTFIEPHPERLLGLTTEADRSRSTFLRQRVQDVDLARFDDLSANDILFIDSSHVLKIGSDVHHLLTEVLPRLQPGVYVHFHDILYPFEYPRRWIETGRYWNEAYALRAFLEFNTAFEIVLFYSFLASFHRAEISRLMPLCLQGDGGSIWIRRVA